MGKKIEPGCMVVVVNSTVFSNIGKTTTVGSFLGRVAGFSGDDRWECDQTMRGDQGSFFNHQNEKNMDRIDNEDITQQIETSKSITA